MEQILSPKNSSNWQHISGMYRWYINCQLGDNNISPSTQKKGNIREPPKQLLTGPSLGCPPAGETASKDEAWRCCKGDGAEGGELRPPFVFWKAWVVLAGQSPNHWERYGKVATCAGFHLVGIFLAIFVWSLKGGFGMVWVLFFKKHKKCPHRTCGLGLLGRRVGCKILRCRSSGFGWGCPTVYEGSSIGELYLCCTWLSLYTGFIKNEPKNSKTSHWVMCQVKFHVVIVVSFKCHQILVISATYSIELLWFFWGDGSILRKARPQVVVSLFTQIPTSIIKIFYFFIDYLCLSEILWVKFTNIIYLYIHNLRPNIHLPGPSN